MEHGCVIDTNGYYVAFCQIKLSESGDLSYSTVVGHQLKEDERIVATFMPQKKRFAGSIGFVKPRWDEGTAAWVEGATAEELAAWEAEHPDPVSLDEKRAAKHAEISAASEAAIKAGMDVTTTQGTEHFSLQETDQINLTAAVTAVQQGAAGYPYHADGELCRMFTAAEIGAVGQASIAHKLYHTTYCNHLFAWIRRATASELARITYGAELPEDLAASMQALLTQAGSTTGEV